ncbi:MAG TPA: hypothetical protein VFV23_06180 [Verrucomicrobiae bacterium]|nr:hypothetical protein [Verrucomicrobiae bacterium]
MKESIKSASGLAFLYSIRAMERSLSVENLRRAFYSFNGPRAAINCAFKKLKPLPPLPEMFLYQKSARLARQQRASFYLNHLLEFFPDRLTEPKWLGRCKIEGIEPLRDAVRAKRPVVLLSAHFGPYYLVRFWLRASGVPVLELFGGTKKNYTRLMQVKNRLSPFPEIPPMLYQDQLRELASLLAAGNVIGLMIDTPFGKQMELPFSDGWNFQMATGGIRLAMRHRADVFPCLIIEDGDWRFRIVFGKPVPREFLLENADWKLAGKHVLDEMVPHFSAHPEQCVVPDLTRCLKPVGNSR